MPIRGPGDSYEVTTPEGSFDTVFYCILDVLRWFTTVDKVRLLFGPEELVLDISNEQQILSGAEENSLRFTNIETDSEVIKKVTESVPPDEVTFSDYDPQSLTNSRFLVNKVKMFAQDDEDYLLENGVDYTADYYKGTVTLVEPDGIAGSASGGTAASLPTFDTEVYAILDVVKKVIVHYEYYTVFVRGTDYSINYTLGRIARLYTGSIDSGDIVYIDYKITQLADDALIRLTIDMTHEWILSQIGTEYVNSTAKNLQYAEVNLAVSNIARSIISKVINEGIAGSPDIHKISNNLGRIESSFKDMGMQFLTPYLNYGVSSAGQVKQNAIFA